MNGFVFLRSHWIAVCICAVFWLGCKQESTKQHSSPQPGLAGGQATPEIRSGPDGETILQEVITRYATAKSYQDEAILYLSYQLEGRNIQEPQCWSTMWDSSGKLAAQLFNGRIRCEDGLMSCYVFDNETANLDNQHLLMPYDQQLPLNQLFRDSIARHFLGGYSELPLDETDLLSSPKLIPAPLSLLTNQVRNGWLQSPTRVQRLPDETIDEKSCYVIRCLSQGMTSDVWIESDSFTLVKMSLPLKLLDGEVVTSPEITDVVLLAEFHDAVLNGDLAVDAFAINPRPDSTPVRKFVALPETLPSELIGQTAPKFRLISQGGKPTSHLDFDGKITTLLWLAGRPSYSAIGQLDSLAAGLPSDKFHFASVYSDSELKSPGTGSIEIADELAAATRLAQCSIYYDSQLAASTALRVNVIPSVIVLDGDSKIQFAESLSNKNWPRDVKAAVERVADGEDVASEMLSEYRRFLDSYRQQLVTLSAADLLEPTATDLTPPVSDGQISAAVHRGNIRLRPEKTWANTEFKQAGNVAVLNAGGSNDDRADRPAYLVFDGWRTVVELDRQGVTKSRFELQLPVGAAVNLIRVGTDSNGKRLFAVFSTLGKQIFLFDHAWNPVGAYPQSDSSDSGIRDCQLTDLNKDGLSELIVAFNDARGIELVNPGSLERKKISTSVANSLVMHRHGIVIAGDGKIGMLKTGLTNIQDTELDFRRVASSGPDHLCGLGVTMGGQWHAVGFDLELKRIWTLSIGSQFFETEIEPIGIAQASTGEFIWAIADTEDAIHLVSGSGKWLGDFQSENQLGGVALSTIDGETQLLVSNQNGIECWNLNLRSNPMRPASTRK